MPNRVAFFMLLLMSGVAMADNEQLAKPELRGLWVTRFEWPSDNPEQCRRNILEILDTMEKANFNAIFFQVRGAAEVLYRSDLEPWSPLVGGKDPGFDPLEFAIAQAHRRGIKLHAYVNPIPLCLWKNNEPPPNPEHLFYRHGPTSKSPWVCCGPQGKPLEPLEYYYLSPGIPEVQAYLRKVVVDMVRRYDIDGVHLDRIRYPGKDASFDPVSRWRFLGRGNPNLLEWGDWQREQLDKFVNDLYAEIAAVKPGVIVSCAAWGIYHRHHLAGYDDFSSGYHDYYQDTWRWVKSGAMDVLIPMIYWNMADPKPNYQELLQDFVEGVGPDRVAGGQRMYGPDWQAVENVGQIVATREKGALGSVIFCYSAAQEKGAFNLLPGDLYRHKAPVPDLEWKKNPQTGIILGTVVDDGGEPVVDAWVSLKPETPADFAGMAKWPTWATGADGRFAFCGVPQVPVQVVVEYPGTEVYCKSIPAAAGVTALRVVMPGAGEAKKRPFLHILAPKEGLTTSAAVHVLGRTAPGNEVRVNGTPVTVYSTGAFAMDNIALNPGENRLEITSKSPDGGMATRLLRMVREDPPAQVAEDFLIKEPAEDLILMPGDSILIRVEGPAGGKCRAIFAGKITLALSEQSGDNKLPTYLGTARIPHGVTAAPGPIAVEVDSPIKLRRESKAQVEIWEETAVRVAEVTAETAGITAGPHYVRLGGPFVAEVPRGTRMEITGKQGEKWRVRLTKSLTGWIDAESVQLLPENTPVPHAFFTYLTVEGSGNSDAVKIPIPEPVVYAIRPVVGAENALEVDFFNTHWATTWAMHKTSARVVKIVTGEQSADDVFRLRIALSGKQIWGYRAERDAGGLTIHVRHPPAIAALPDSPVKGLVIALEAGHGGDNTGAIGLMGTVEKTVNFNAVVEIQRALEKRGAKVVLLRKGDAYPTLPERVRTAIAAGAHLLISVHANATATDRGYLRVCGTSTYYKYPHCHRLARSIYDELLKLGLAEYGVVGNFNYLPVRASHIPAVLIEQAFLSHPGDEARLLDPDFPKLHAEAVIRGVEEFLNAVRE